MGKRHENAIHPEVQHPEPEYDPIQHRNNPRKTSEPKDGNNEHGANRKNNNKHDRKKIGGKIMKRRSTTIATIMVAVFGTFLGLGISVQASQPNIRWVEPVAENPRPELREVWIAPETNWTSDRPVLREEPNMSDRPALRENWKSLEVRPERNPSPTEDYWNERVGSDWRAAEPRSENSPVPAESWEAPRQ